MDFFDKFIITFLRGKHQAKLDAARAAKSTLEKNLQIGVDRHHENLIFSLSRFFAGKHLVLTDDKRQFFEYGIV